MLTEAHLLSKAPARLSTPWSLYHSTQNNNKHPLLTGSRTQLAKLTAFTRVSALSRNKRVSIYTDCRYAFLALHAHSTIWKDRQFLTASGFPTEYHQEITGPYRRGTHALEVAARDTREEQVRYWKGIAWPRQQNPPPGARLPLLLPA